METIIEKATNSVQRNIEKFPSKVLSEADFERMLTNYLEIELLKSKSEFSVHSQISYYEEYGNSHPKYRVDILLMKEKEMEKCKDQYKGFIYSGQSYVFELKYLHEKDAVNVVRSDMKNPNCS